MYGLTRPSAAWLLGLIAYDSSQRAIQPPWCATPTVNVAGWAARGGSAFTIRAPLAYKTLPIGGIDSETGGWFQPGRRLSYDYGSFSQTLDSLPDLTSVRRCLARIGGRTASVVAGRDSAGRFVAGAHWDSLPKSAVGRVSLTLYGSASDSIGRDELLGILWTVRFKR